MVEFCTLLAVFLTYHFLSRLGNPRNHGSSEIRFVLLSFAKRKVRNNIRTRIANSVVKPGILQVAELSSWRIFNCCLSHVFHRQALL